MSQQGALGSRMVRSAEACRDEAQAGADTGRYNAASMKQYRYSCCCAGPYCAAQQDVLLNSWNAACQGSQLKNLMLTDSGLTEQQHVACRALLTLTAAGEATKTSSNSRSSSSFKSGRSHDHVDTLVAPCFCCHLSLHVYSTFWRVGQPADAV